MHERLIKRGTEEGHTMNWWGTKWVRSLSNCRKISGLLGRRASLEGTDDWHPLKIFFVNTRFIYDFLYYTESHNIPGLLILIDFEKAFDSISWDFIYKDLQYFNFGNYIINWINILNTDFNACVLQSGFMSKQCFIQRGCRQGDPVAPYLFLLCA